MPIIKTKFGETEKGEVYSYLLDNGKGFSVEILNYGGIIRSILYNGTDVALGKETLADYLDNEEYFGAIVGRNVGRILNGTVEIEGKKYELSKNSNGSNGHGGFEGFDKKIWLAEEKDGEEPALTLSYVSSDGEEGFPGTLEVTVTYTVKKDNTLSICYEGISDKATLFNPTNHAYFNMNGHSSGRIDGQLMELASGFYLANAVDEKRRGEVHSVSETPMDFRKEKELGIAFSSEHPEIIMCRGLDHNFAVSGTGFRKVGSLRGEKTGIKMEIYSDRNGVGIYSGAYIREGLKGKNGASYANAHGICFETQNFNNGRGLSHLEAGIIKAGERLKTVTEFRFI